MRAPICILTILISLSFTTSPLFGLPDRAGLIQAEINGINNAKTGVQKNLNQENKDWHKSQQRQENLEGQLEKDPSKAETLQPQLDQEKEDQAEREERMKQLSKQIDQYNNQLKDAYNRLGEAKGKNDSNGKQTVGPEKPNDQKIANDKLGEIGRIEAEQKRLGQELQTEEMRLARDPSTQEGRGPQIEQIKEQMTENNEKLSGLWKEVDQADYRAMQASGSESGAGSGSGSSTGTGSGSSSSSGSGSSSSTGSGSTSDISVPSNVTSAAAAADKTLGSANHPFFAKDSIKNAGLVDGQGNPLYKWVDATPGSATNGQTMYSTMDYLNSVAANRVNGTPMNNFSGLYGSGGANGGPSAYTPVGASTAASNISGISLFKPDGLITQPVGTNFVKPVMPTKNQSQIATMPNMDSNGCINGMCGLSRQPRQPR